MIQLHRLHRAAWRRYHFDHIEAGLKGDGMGAQVLGGCGNDPPLLFPRYRFPGRVKRAFASGFYLYEGNILPVGSNYVYLPKAAAHIGRQNGISLVPQETGGQHFPAAPADGRAISAPSLSF